MSKTRAALCPCLVVWPFLTLLAALTLVCFGIAYDVFMRQEIRSV